MSSKSFGSVVINADGSHTRQTLESAMAANSLPDAGDREREAGIAEMEAEAEALKKHNRKIYEQAWASRIKGA